MIKVKIKLDSGATMPTRATSGSVGYDVTALRVKALGGEDENVDLTKKNLYRQCGRYMTVCGGCGSYRDVRLCTYKLIIDTGVHVQPEDGYYVELVPNSRLAKLGLIYGNSIGVIDPDYTGSIKCILDVLDTASLWDLEHFLPGNVIGQLIIRKKYDADFIQVDELDETERGDGSFGSTARLAQNA